MSNKASSGKNAIDLQQDFSEVLRQIQRSRQKVFAQVNTALIDLYWHIGKTISHKVQAEAWGKGVVSELARYIAQNDPEIKGFSDKNLWRMKQFHETYRDDEKLLPLVQELPWTHNTLIFSRCKTTEEREYYLKLTAMDKLSKRELERQINASHFERSLLAVILSPVARELQPNIVNTFKDTYVLEFLGLPTVHSENDLQKALIQMSCLQVRLSWIGKYGKGAHWWTKSKNDASKIESARNLLASGVEPGDVAKDLGVSVPTPYMWLPASF